MVETVRTASLNPEQIEIHDKFLKDFKVAVCDIDYTLVDFEPAHQAGIAAIGEVMGEEFAREIAKSFEITLEGHRLKYGHLWERRDEFEDLLEQTKNLHKGFSEIHGHKVWSRETWIILTAKRMGIELTGSRVTELRDKYWSKLTEDSKMYPDANEFLHSLDKLGIVLILMTGSDSILKIHDDLTVDYDSEFSEQYKKRRVLKLGFNAEGIVIGDPIDKPDPRYFEKVFKKVGHISDANKTEVLVVGDSQRNDLDVPADLGYPTLLINRA